MKSTPQRQYSTERGNVRTGRPNACELQEAVKSLALNLSCVVASLERQFATAPDKSEGLAALRLRARTMASIYDQLKCECAGFSAIIERLLEDPSDEPIDPQ